MIRMIQHKTSQNARMKLHIIICEQQQYNFKPKAT